MCERQKNGKTVGQVTSCTCNAIAMKILKKVHEQTDLIMTLNKIFAILDKKSVNNDFLWACSREPSKSSKVVFLYEKLIF